MASETKRKHDEDPYELLGLTSGCDEKAIEKAWRIAALKWHPDKNKQKHAKDMFLKVQTAYDFLKDKTVRKEFDAEIAAKQRRKNYDDEVRASSSKKRNAFIEQLKKREEALLKKEAEKKFHKREKRKEKPLYRESTNEQLARESEEMRRRKEQEMKTKEAELLKQSEPKQSNLQFNMSMEDFAKFEAEVLGNM